MDSKSKKAAEKQIVFVSFDAERFNGTISQLKNVSDSVIKEFIELFNKYNNFDTAVCRIKNKYKYVNCIYLCTASNFSQLADELVERKKYNNISFSWQVLKEKEGYKIV